MMATGDRPAHTAPPAPVVVPPVADHVERLIGVRDPHLQLAKVIEESGEALTAFLETQAGHIPPDSTEDELADTILAAIGALQILGHDVADVVAARWEHVRTRTHTAQAGSNRRGDNHE